MKQNMTRIDWLEYLSEQKKIKLSKKQEMHREIDYSSDIPAIRAVLHQIVDKL